MTRYLNPLRALLDRASPHQAESRSALSNQGLNRQATHSARNDLSPRIEETDLCWIYGAGRSGSTWLLEMLHDLPYIRTWNEPYFGRICAALNVHPDETKHSEVFFANAYRQIWTTDFRWLFLEMAEARFGALPEGTKLIIKDVNSPELCPFFADIFPHSRYLLLLRDPFDTLDSYIDMQRPGSWSEAFGESFGAERSAARIEGTARHICSLYETAISGYDRVQPDLRLQLRYEDLLAHPVESLKACSEFLGVTLSERQLQRSIEMHRFEKHKEQGQTAFRRFGKAGIWQTSGNFTPEVTQIATEVLGDLRQRLGY